VLCAQAMQVLVEIPALQRHVLRQWPPSEVYENFGLRAHQLFSVRVAVYRATQRTALQQRIGSKATLYSRMLDKHLQQHLALEHALNLFHEQLQAHQVAYFKPKRLLFTLLRRLSRASSTSSSSYNRGSRKNNISVIKVG
jgi:hypothetical protein